MRKNIAKAVASVAALAAIAAGAAAVSGADTSSTADSGRMGGPPGMAGAGRGSGPPGDVVTGAAADKVEAAVTKRYPGTIERVMQTPDGGYMTLVTKSDGSRLMVRVSEDFEVLEADDGGTDAPPGGTAPPSGAAPAGSSAARSS